MNICNTMVKLLARMPPSFSECYIYLCWPVHEPVWCNQLNPGAV